jgi:hypothetical protein
MIAIIEVIVIIVLVICIAGTLVIGPAYLLSRVGNNGTKATILKALGYIIFAEVYIAGSLGLFRGLDLKLLRNGRQPRLHPLRPFCSERVLFIWVP